MKRIVFLIAFPLIGAQAAAIHEFGQPCAELYPRVAQFMTAAQFEPTISDSAGGLLTMKYVGEPMAPFRRDTKALFNKYVVTGEKQRAGAAPMNLVFPYWALSYSRASLTFTKSDGGCRVNLDIVLGAFTDNGRRWVVVPGNGSAERELMDRFTDTLQPKAGEQ